MNAPAELRDVTLDDKYALERGRVFLTGIQALVRLPILQRQRDLAAGLNTAGFVSGAARGILLVGAWLPRGSASRVQAGRHASTLRVTPRGTSTSPDRARRSRCVGS